MTRGIAAVEDAPGPFGDGGVQHIPVPVWRISMRRHRVFEFTDIFFRPGLEMIGLEWAERFARTGVVR